MKRYDPIVRAGSALVLAGAFACSAGGAGSSDASRVGGQGGGAGAGAGSVAAGGSAGHGASSVAGSTGIAGFGAAGSPGSGGVTSSGGAASVGGAGPGAAGAGANGGASGAPSNPCSARPGLLFCDDFESVALGVAPGAPWSLGLNPMVGPNTVTVDNSVPAHSGTKSVHVHGDGFQTLLVYHDPAVLPQASGKFYSRAFVRFGAPMTGGHNTFVIADTFAAPGAGNTTRIGEMNAMLMMTVNGDTHGYLSNQNYYNDMKPGVQFAAQAYTCLEMLFDAPGTTIDIWVNGAEVPDLHVTNLAHENYDALRFGFESYAGPVSDIWYDDIAIGTQPIGCN